MPELGHAGFSVYHLCRGDWSLDGSYGPVLLK